MAKIDESQLGDDFRYILRLAMADVDGMKPIGLGLTSIDGVGQRTAIALCGLADIDAKKMGGLLSDKEIDLLKEAIESYPTAVPLWMLNRQRDLHSGDELHLFSQDVKMVQKEDIDRHRAVKSYRGVRHAIGGRVRGQRTRSNNRSGLTLGVQRKK
jgi:small subunit ribosomal protein S13